jgi:transketolase
VFVVCGDGELHEGSNWEAIMFASHHELDNLNVIIDNNSICMLGYTDDVLSHDGFSERFRAFGWSVYGVNGHDVDQLATTLSRMKQSKGAKPKLLVADTVKGRGVSNLENQPLSHVFAADQNEVSELLGGWEDD